MFAMSAAVDSSSSCDRYTTCMSASSPGFLTMTGTSRATGRTLSGCSVESMSRPSGRSAASWLPVMAPKCDIFVAPERGPRLDMTVSLCSSVP